MTDATANQKKRMSSSIHAIIDAEVLRCPTCANIYTSEWPPPGSTESNRIPVMLACCGNTVCSACAENHRSSMMSKRKPNRKRGRPTKASKEIKCLICDGSFEAKDFMPNRAVLSMIEIRTREKTQNVSEHEEDDRAKEGSAQAAALEIAKERSEAAKLKCDGARVAYEAAKVLVAKAENVLNTAKVNQAKAAVAYGNANYESEDAFRVYTELKKKSQVTDGRSR